MAKDIRVALTLDNKDFNSKIKSSENSLSKLNSKAGSSTASLTKLTKVFAGLSAAAIVVQQSVGKIITVQRQFDVINASLITVTGSTENAAAAFDKIKAFAASTPYDLAQVANGFVKLKALGLDPSERALNSYGNTASAMGKDLNQMVEAVADAATGEFERLKEFGIKARQQGDEVKLTFQGVTTSIGNNSEEIQEYLLKLGEIQFAGAMDERAATLDGALSNLADSWDNLFLTVSQTGLGKWFEDTARGASALITQIDNMITGEVDGIQVLAKEYGKLIKQKERLEAAGPNGANTQGPIGRDALRDVNARMKEIEAFTAQRTLDELHAQQAKDFTTNFVGPAPATASQQNKMDRDREEEAKKAIRDKATAVRTAASEARALQREAAREIESQQQAAIREQERYNDLIIKNNQEMRSTVGEKKAELANIVNELNLERELMGLSEAQKEIAHQMAAIDAERLITIAEIQALQLSTNPIASLGLQLIAIGEINAAYETQGSLIRQTAEENQRVAKEFSTGWQESMANFKESVENQAAYASQLFDTVTNGFSDAFANFVDTGKLSFRSLINDVLKQIIKMQANKAFLGLFGAGGLAAGSGIGKLFSGFFADGGKIPSGKFGVVGEAGAELVSGPATVTPMNQIGNGGTTQVTYNINAVDAMSFKQMLARDPEYLYAVTQRGSQRS